MEFVIVDANGRIVFGSNASGHAAVRLSKSVIPGTPMRRVFDELVPIS
jgi:hypothetical protein